MTSPYTITRKQPWTVQSPDGSEIDRHNEFKEAVETATNYCLSHPRQVVKILGPTLEAVYNPGQSVEPPASEWPPPIEEPPPPPVVPDGAIPQDLAILTPSVFVPWVTGNYKEREQWQGDTRFVGLNEWHPQSPDWINWGDWCAGNGTNRLLVQDSTIKGMPGHRGQPWRWWAEYYFLNTVFDGLQWSTESNDGSKPGALINCVFENVGEDAIRDVYGQIENVEVRSVRPVGNDPHGDTVDWKSGIENAGIIKNLKSTTGQMHGIITVGVKNLVIDGYEHIPPGDAGWSIMFGGDVENITIRNCKMGGNIVFRGRKKNVFIDWDTVRVNVPREEFDSNGG